MALAQTGRPPDTKGNPPVGARYIEPATPGGPEVSGGNNGRGAIHRAREAESNYKYTIKMDKQNMEALLDRVYELEGLLHLALSRDDAPARLKDIIRLKGRRIAEIIASGADEPTPAAAPIAEEEEAAVELAPASAPIAEEEEAADEAPRLPGAALAAEPTQPKAEEAAKELEPEEPGEEPAEPAEEPEPDAAPMLEEEWEMSEAWKAETPSIQQERPKVRTGHLKSRFSLNDRFRFSRELFSGEPRRFDAAVEHLNVLPSYDEARDYLVTDLGWDLEADDAAAEFAEIIAPFY